MDHLSLYPDDWGVIPAKHICKYKDKVTLDFDYICLLVVLLSKVPCENDNYMSTIKECLIDFAIYSTSINSD